jgi:hypothetical protein
MRRDRADSAGLAMSRVEGHMCHVGPYRVAYHKVPPVRWSFRTEAERNGIINAAAARYGLLVGRRIHIRVTSKPYDVGRWARGLDANTPNPLPYWHQHLTAEQHRLRLKRPAGKETYLGVRLTQPKHKRAEYWAEPDTVAHIVAGPGLGARPVTPGELEYLNHRSNGLGFPAPLTLPPEREVWESDDLFDLTEWNDWTQPDPFGSSVQIVADVNGTVRERHVTVCTLGRVSDGLDIPGRMDPWMQVADRVFPVEWSVLADVLPENVVTSRMRGVLDQIAAQAAHHRDKKQPVPEKMERTAKHAQQVIDEVGSDDPRNVRLDAWVRFAVAADTPEESRAQAQRVIDRYNPLMTFTVNKAQYATAREFIPGEPLATTAHRRRMPARLFAAAVPAAQALIGDRYGINVGETWSGPVNWDTHAAMEKREGAGLAVLTGGLGSGKTVLLAGIAYKTALRGVKTVLLDPAGRLQRMCDIPELRDYATSIDLMSAAPGSLNPYAVIADPLPTHHQAVWEDGMNPEQWRARSAELLADAVTQTEADRATLTKDTLRGLLAESVAKQTSTEKLLEMAVKQVRATRDASPRQVIDVLAGHRGDDAQFLADYFTRIAATSQGRLIFPAANAWPADRAADDRHVLRVLTMRGNTLPSGSKKPADWSERDRLAVAALSLAAVLTTQHVITRDPNERKLVGFDEGHIFAKFPAGAALIANLSRDFTRKWNTRFVFASQLAGDIFAVDGTDEFVDCAFVGRTTSPAGQRDGLRLLGVTADGGYEAKLGALSERDRESDDRLGYREFVFNDGNGGIEIIRSYWDPRLAEYLDSTATGVAVPEVPVRESVDA